MNEIHALAQRRATVASRLFMVMAVLLVLDVFLQTMKYEAGHDYLFGLVRLFDVDEEANLPTLFSTLLLLSAGLLLAMIGREEKARGGPDGARWTFLSAVFLFLMVDESASLHELLILPGRELLGKQIPGIFYYAWVIPYFVLVVALAAYMLGFFLRLPWAIKIRFVLAAVLFIGGSIGFELAEGAEDMAYGQKNMLYSVLTAVEEGMEMAGVIVFIHALLQYIAVGRTETTASAAIASREGHRNVAG